MNILQALFTIFAFLILLLVLYYILDRFFTWKRFFSNNVPKQVIDFFIGITMGGFALVVQYAVSESIDISADIEFFVPTMIIILFHRNYSSSMYAAAPSLIFFVFVEDIDYQIYVLVAMTFITLIAHEIIFTTADKTKGTWIWIVIALAISFASWIISSPFDDDGFSFSSLVFLFFPFVFGAIILLILNWLTLFGSSSAMLYESSNLTFGGFYRASLAEEALGTFIQKTKPTNGSLIVFRFKYQTSLDRQRNEEILESILTSIVKQYGDNNVYFDSTNALYGLFTERTDLREIEKMFNKIPKSYLSSWNEIIDVSIRAGIAQYGQDSSNINELIRFATYEVNTGQKNINVFNYKQFRDSRKSQKEVEMLDEFIHLENFSNTYSTIVDHNNEIFAIKVDIENNSEFVFGETLDEMTNTFNWQDHFYRYFAAEAIKKASLSKGNIAITYPATIFTERFDIELFLEKVSSQIDPNSLYLIIRKVHLDMLNSDDNITEKIAELRECGVRFIYDANISKSRLLRIDPKAHTLISTSDDTWHADDSFDLIVENIQDVDMIKGIFKSGAKFVSGAATKKSINFIKINKQSKIYI